MGKISGWRVLLGGLFAGAILLLGQGLLFAKLLVPQSAGLIKDNLWLADAASGGAVWVMIVSDLLTGVLIAWLYAAVRPRLGAGLMTAIIVGLAAWCLMFLQGWVPEYAWAPRLRETVPLQALVSLVLYLLAASVAAWLYSEALEGGNARRKGR